MEIFEKANTSDMTKLIPSMSLFELEVVEEDNKAGLVIKDCSDNCHGRCGSE